MLRRTKEDLETKLPDKIQINVKLNLTALQLKVYQDILRTNDLFDLTGSAKKFNGILMQLRKCCNHPYMFDGIEEESDEEFGAHIVTNSEKMMFVDKLLDKCKKTKE